MASTAMAIGGFTMVPGDSAAESAEALWQTMDRDFSPKAAYLEVRRVGAPPETGGDLILIPILAGNTAFSNSQ